MSFPKEPIVIRPEEISRFDVIIEDRKLVARGGTEVATQESNAAAKASYYFRLIESLALTIRSKEKTEKVEWNLSTYHRATERIMSLVSKANTPVPKRFIWYRQFPHPHYVVMTRQQTVNKLANDLDCEIRKLKARESSGEVMDQQVPKKKQKPTQKRYGKSLILKVCRAVRKGMSPYKAALLLDRPLTPNSMATEEVNLVPASDWQESESERSMRLLLRQRFLACIRDKKCIIDFANALLSMWGLPNVPKDIPAKNSRKKKKVVSAFTTYSKQKVAQVQNVLAPSVPVEHKFGPWNLEERTAFLTGVEQYGFPRWRDIAAGIPTRSHYQAATFGRSLQRKFGLGNGICTDAALREYLLSVHESDEGVNLPETNIIEEKVLETGITEGKTLETSGMEEKLETNTMEGKQQETSSTEKKRLEYTSRKWD